VNRPKEGTVYYERVFADADVDPRQALVVDNSPLALGWRRVWTHARSWSDPATGKIGRQTCASEVWRSCPEPLTSSDS
jgi:hypothetical protein